MNADSFVRALRARVIENSSLDYQKLLETTKDSKELEWKAILPFYKNLTEEQKISFIKFIRLVQLNTLSHVLGIIDGSTYLDETKEQFKLSTNSDGNIISGDLQNILWQLEE